MDPVLISPLSLLQLGQVAIYHTSRYVGLHRWCHSFPIPRIQLITVGRSWKIHHVSSVAGGEIEGGGRLSITSMSPQIRLVTIDQPRTDTKLERTS